MLIQIAKSCRHPEHPHVAIEKALQAKGTGQNQLWLSLRHVVSLYLSNIWILKVNTAVCKIFSVTHNYSINVQLYHADDYVRIQGYKHKLGFDQSVNLRFNYVTYQPIPLCRCTKT